MKYIYRCDCGNEVEREHGMTVKTVVLCKCGKEMYKAITGGNVNTHFPGSHNSDYKS